MTASIAPTLPTRLGLVLPQFANAEEMAVAELERRFSAIIAHCRDEAMVMVPHRLAGHLLRRTSTIHNGHSGPAIRVLSDARPSADTVPAPTGGSIFRRIASVPLLLVVADHRHAMVALPRQHDQVAVRMAIPEVIPALVEVFEFLWRSVPAGPARRLLNERQARIVAGLAEGLTDAAVAARLDLTERTVRRDVSALMREAGVVSRFQLGARAQSLGWLPTVPR